MYYSVLIERIKCPDVIVAPSTQGKYRKCSTGWCMNISLFTDNGDPRTCIIFIPAQDSNWGSLGFPLIKITVVRQVRISPASTVV